MIMHYDFSEMFWALRLRALIDNPESFAATYEETLRIGKDNLIHRLHPDEKAFYLGAFEPDLVGMVYFRRDEGIKNRHKERILSMYVQLESRGLEVGKALLQELITQANRLSGLEQLHLMVVTTNEAARS
jgi:GNAT superfamily N-acetyltransferase